MIKKTQGYLSLPALVRQHVSAWYFSAQRLSSGILVVFFLIEVGALRLFFCVA